MDNTTKNKHDTVNMALKRHAFDTVLRSTGFPITVIRWELEGCSAFRHTHEFHELIVVLTGHGLHHIGSERHAVKRGDIYLVRPGVPHHYEGMTGLSIYNILYIPEALGACWFDLLRVPGYRAFFELEPSLREQSGFPPSLKLTGEKFDQVLILIEKIMIELQVRQPGYGCMAVAGLMELLCLLSRAYALTETTKAASLLKLEQVLTYLNEHMTEPINLKDLARKAAMSESVLLRRFREATGTTPVNYLIRLRVQSAASQLLGSDDSIKEIARCNGFDDSNYFSRTFRKYIGCSPRAYRKAGS